MKTKIPCDPSTLEAKQENYCDFETSLDYAMNSRSVWIATEQDCLTPKLPMYLLSHVFNDIRNYLNPQTEGLRILIVKRERNLGNVLKLVK